MSNLLCHTAAGIATVTINRPAQRNSMTCAMWREIGELFNSLSDDTSVRGIILTGAGDDFSAGADINEFASIRADKVQSVSYEEAVDYGCAAIAHAAKPVIAVTRGYCVGGGVHLAMSCDFRYAHSNSIFGVPAARLSIVYGVEATRKLLSLVGQTEAKRILYSGERFDATRALETGFADKVSDDPAGDALAFAGSLSNCAPLTIRGAKYILNALAYGGFDAQEANRLIDSASASEDYHEGRFSFAEKRPPEFKGY